MARALVGSRRLPLLLLLMAVMWFMWFQSSARWLTDATSRNRSLLRAVLPRDRSTLVAYIYSYTDLEYKENLYYFLEHGVKPDDGVDYVIVMQEGNTTMGATKLPSLPSNVRVLKHPNGCFDWGTFGWLIQSGLVDTSKYRYIVFVNSSVRGPFLPPYWPRELHWTEVFTGRLNDTVKLVGSTISCEGAWKGGVLTGERRQNPHVQSYVVAMDQEALSVLREDGAAIKCYESYHDAVWYAEMGSSAAVLKAGYNIDALMLRYQGVDWRDTNNWGCNAALNPYAEYMYDGINLSPFEVMFVKIKDYLLQANWTAAATVKKYTDWVHEKDVISNEYSAKKEHLRRIKIISMRERGPHCFDFDYYKKRNPDLPVPPWTAEHLWEHFVKDGQHEGRVFRFRCPSPGERVTLSLASPPPPTALPAPVAVQQADAATAEMSDAQATASNEAVNTQATEMGTTAVDTTEQTTVMDESSHAATVDTTQTATGSAESEAQAAAGSGSGTTTTSGSISSDLVSTIQTTSSQENAAGGSSQTVAGQGGTGANEVAADITEKETLAAGTGMVNVEAGDGGATA